MNSNAWLALEASHVWRSFVMYLALMGLEVFGLRRPIRVSPPQAGLAADPVQSGQSRPASRGSIIVEVQICLMVAPDAGQAAQIGLALAQTFVIASDSAGLARWSEAREWDLPQVRQVLDGVLRPT